MTEIFCLAVAVLGFVLGVGVEAFVDNRSIKELNDENRALRRKIISLKKALSQAGVKREVIEIIDNRTNSEDSNLFRPF